MKKGMQIVITVIITLALISCQFISELSGPEQTGQKWDATYYAPGTVEPPVLDPAPEMAPLPYGNEVQQAAALDANLVGGVGDVPTWLRLYDMLGIPVLDEKGNALGSTGDDPIGSPYWLVWYTATLNKPGRGISLANAGQMLAVGLEGADPAEFSAALLSDLRGGLVSNVPEARLLAEFFRLRAMKIGAETDLANPEATVENISIDIPTVLVLNWVLTRGVMAELASQAALPAGFKMAAPVAATLAQAESSPCSGGDSLTYWTNWIVNKAAGGGIQFHGMKESLPSLVQVVQKTLGVSKNIVEETGVWMGRLSPFTGLVSLIMQVLAMDVDFSYEPDQLIRNKKRSQGDGKEMTIQVALVSRPDKLPDGSKAGNCFISVVTNMLGVGVSFPTEGRITGAEIFFEGGQNFDRVYFADYKQIRQWTNTNGEVALTITGRTQKRDYPDDAQQEEMEFSVKISAQPEEAGINTMANMFLNGLLFGAGTGSPEGLFGPLVDMLKVFRYDLGQYYFPLVDWKSEEYLANGSGGDIAVNGPICSLSKPFTLDMTGGAAGTFQFTPASEKGGTMIYEGIETNAGFSMTGSGNYQVVYQDEKAVQIVTETSGCVHTNLGDSCRSNTMMIDLTEAEGLNCSP